jgi:hypothetical protein
MRRLVLARTVLAAMGVVVWGYGYRVDDPTVRLAGIALLAISLLLRFLPARWLGNDTDR